MRTRVRPFKSAKSQFCLLSSTHLFDSDVELDLARLGLVNELQPFAILHRHDVNALEGRSLRIRRRLNACLERTACSLHNSCILARLRVCCRGIRCELTGILLRLTCVICRCNRHLDMT